MIPSRIVLANTCRSMSSIHSRYNEEIHDVPMGVIKRPLIPELDQKKVQSIAETLKDPATANQVPPIDVLWITDNKDQDYYFSFNGCHRFEAHKLLMKDTIKAKLIRSTSDDLKVYLGSSAPKFE